MDVNAEARGLMQARGAVLGSMLLDPDIVGEVMLRLQPEDLAARRAAQPVRSLLPAVRADDADRPGDARRRGRRGVWADRAGDPRSHANGCKLGGRMSTPCATARSY